MQQIGFTVNMIKQFNSKFQYLKGSFARKSINKLSLFLPIAVVTLVVGNSYAQEQPVPMSPSQTYWDNIRNADSKVEAIQVKWKATQVHLPNDYLTDQKIEEIMANVADQESKLDLDLSLNEVDRRAKFARKQLNIDRIGSSQTSNLSFIRVGKQIRADTVFEPQHYVGSTDNQSWRSHTIDFYDWQSSVALNEVFDVAENGSTMKSSSWTGERWQAPKHALWRSAATFGQLFFLPGQSVTVSYDPNKTTIHEGENNTIILEIIDSKDQDKLHRTIISKEMWKPLSSETIVKSSGYVLLRIEAKGYKQYKDGIWFPTELTERFGNKQTTQFTLKEVKFNDDVDPAGLRLPAGANLRDERFGEVTSYKITDGSLPTDAEVRKMLGEQSKEAKAMAQAENMGKRQISAMMVPIAGLLLMAMSCALWVRSFKKQP